MYRKPVVIALSCAAAAAIASAVPARADAAGIPCLTRYVPRGAFAGDGVCVTPQTRRETLADNAAAVSRRDPNAGFGPFGCRSGFVWRVARASDLVCVLPEMRQRVAIDNAADPRRRNTMTATVGRFRSGDTFYYAVSITGINYGSAFLGLYRGRDGAQLAGWRKSFGVLLRGSGPHTFFTDRRFCNGAANAYFRVKDPVSNRWSERQPVNTSCSGL